MALDLVCLLGMWFPLGGGCTDLRGEVGVWGEGQLPEHLLLDSLFGVLSLALLQLLMIVSSELCSCLGPMGMCYIWRVDHLLPPQLYGLGSRFEHALRHLN